VIQKQVGFPFYNHSRFDLTRIKSDPNNVMMNFNNYLQGYSDNVRDIIDNFAVDPLVKKLDSNKRLYLLIDKFTEFDLHPSVIDNHQMGSVYEELLRRFSEMSNDDLDSCHGHDHGALGHHYHSTIEYPYTVGCYTGTPVSSPYNIVPPLGGGPPGVRR